MLSWSSLTISALSNQNSFIDSPVSHLNILDLSRSKLYISTNKQGSAQPCLLVEICFFASFWKELGEKLDENVHKMLLSKARSQPKAG